MSKDSKALVKRSGAAIEAWAERGDVRELAERLQTMMPGAKALTPPQALSLAQAAIAHGLDPFNGELWWIPGSGLMAGIKGLRRGAHRELDREGGGNYWPEFDQLDVDEKTALGIPQDALAYRCKIRDTQTINHYVSQIERMTKAGIPWEIVNEIVGARPYTEGIGYAEKSERSKMSLVQRAQKRAEADALKRRFDLPFGEMVGMNGGDDVVIDAEFVTEGMETNDMTADDTPFGTPKDAIEWGFEQGVFKTMEHAENSYEKLKREKEPENAREMARLWREYVANKLADKELAESQPVNGILHPDEPEAEL